MKPTLTYPEQTAPCRLKIVNSARCGLSSRSSNTSYEIGNANSSRKSASPNSARIPRSTHNILNKQAIVVRNCDTEHEDVIIKSSKSQAINAPKPEDYSFELSNVLDQQKINQQFYEKRFLEPMIEDKELNLFQKEELEVISIFRKIDTNCRNMVSIQQIIDSFGVSYDKQIIAQVLYDMNCEDFLKFERFREFYRRFRLTKDQDFD